MTLPRTPTETHRGSDGQPWFEQYLPAPEATKRIRILGRKRTVFLKVDQQGHVDEKTYFPIMGSIRTTRAQAMKFVEDSYKHFTERGALVHLVWCDNCLFVG